MNVTNVTGSHKCSHGNWVVADNALGSQIILFFLFTLVLETLSDRSLLMEIRLSYSKYCMETCEKDKMKRVLC